MKLVLASAVLASLLLAGVRAHAEADVDPTEAVSLPVGRCLEVPMSVAMAIVEGEAVRWLPPQAAMSTTAVAPPATEQVQPGRPALPYTPLVQLCASPDDPRCHISAPFPSPSRVQLDAMDHGFAPAPAALSGPEPVVTLLPQPEARPVMAGPHAAHDQPPWRPPAV